MPTLMAATKSLMGAAVNVPASIRRCKASPSATKAPVIDAVRVPPSAWITSQSIQIVRSPNRFKSATARSERPIRRCISCVRPLCFPRAASRAVRVSVERGSIPYSPEIHPLPELRRNTGTVSSTDAVQMTRVLPISISAEPSAVEMKSGMMLTGRICSGARLSLRKIIGGILTVGVWIGSQPALQVVILSGVGTSRSEAPAESKDPYTLLAQQGRVREFSPCSRSRREYPASFPRQKVDQLFSRKPRLSQQRHQSSLRQVAIMLRHHGAAARDRIVKNEVAAGCVIQNEAVPFQKADDLTRLNGGELRHTPSRARLRGCCHR